MSPVAPWLEYHAPDREGTLVRFSVVTEFFKYLLLKVYISTHIVSHD